MPEYTVIDVETTGLSPARGDRIVEIGIVYVSGDGDIQGQWSSLVDPGRDVGPTHVHGITVRDIRDAPTFTQLAPQVVEALAGRVPVAHNASFDMRFLRAELEDAGVAIPAGGLSAVCTMKHARTFFEVPSRTLADCCAAARVNLDNAHCAEADAVATAQLFGCYVRRRHTPEPWHAEALAASSAQWPVLQGSPVRLRSRMLT